MNTTPSSLGMHPSTSLPVPGAPPRPTEENRAESLQRTGRKMILAGFVVSIAGVILYCAACFAGGMDAELGDLLLTHSVPFAHATLGVLGLGTLVWLIGSFTYLKGAMDADDGLDRQNPPGTDGTS